MSWGNSGGGSNGSTPKKGGGDDDLYDMYDYSIDLNTAGGAGGFGSFKPPGSSKGEQRNSNNKNDAHLHFDSESQSPGVERASIQIPFIFSCWWYLRSKSARATAWKDDDGAGGKDDDGAASAAWDRATRECGRRRLEAHDQR